MSLATTSRTDRNASTKLRHGRAHRANAEAIAAKRDTVVFAERCASFTLPTVVGQWKIAKATPEQEAWAKRMANR